MMTLDKILEAYELLEVRGDVYRLLDSLGIHLFYQDMEIPAKLYTYKGYDSIFVRTNIQNEEYYILHEIGHYLLHQGTSLYYYGNSRAEFEADLFACIYLINADLSCTYYEMYLVDKGVPTKVITRFQDTLYQYLQAKHYGDVWLRMEC